jgi:hypothetical protein
VKFESGAKICAREEWVSKMEVVFEEMVPAGFSIRLDISPGWPRRAPELCKFSLVVLMDKGCHDHHQFGITIKVIVQ